MISYLKGKVLLKSADYIILETNGVGYKVFVSGKMLKKIPEHGEEVALFCHLHARENVLALYGMETFDQLKVFEVVNGISGIGPRSALEIASLGSLAELEKAIEAKDEKFFVGVHGIGKKKAQKIIVELTGKIENFEMRKRAKRDDAIDSLVALGFPRAEAQEALDRVPSEIAAVEQRVKEALKILGQR